MRFKKQPNVEYFSKYTREDGKYTIESTYTYINGKPKAVFEVTDEEGNVIDTFLRLKDAKAKYSGENEEKEIEEEKTMTVKEMRAEAKAMGIKGYSRMSKEELQEKIEAAKTPETQAEERTTVIVRAFTGMLLGEFEVVKETKKLLIVKTKKGNELKFDKSTGLQTNGNNPKFANYVEF